MAHNNYHKGPRKERKENFKKGKNKNKKQTI